MNAPLVPSYVDLTDFSFMPLDVRRLRDSDLASDETPEACWAALLLWAASWHQVPAGSIPKNDAWQAKQAGYAARGKIDKAWAGVRSGALRGFIECDDGRLYHPVVAEKANEAWQQKQEHAHRRACDRIRKENKARSEKKLAPLEIPDFDAWNGADALRRSDGIPLEKTLKGTEQTRTDRTVYSVPTGTGDVSPPDPAEIIFASGVPMLEAAGVKEKNARSMLGMFRKQHGDEAVVAMLQRCAVEKPLEPVSWMQAVLKVKSVAAKSAGPPWWASDEGVLAMGREMEMLPRTGESMPSYKARLQAAIHLRQAV